MNLSQELDDMAYLESLSHGDGARASRLAGQAREMEAELARMEATVLRLEALERRCVYHGLVDPLLSGERLCITVEWVDRLKAGRRARARQR